jgi:predicted nucleotidyltransferase
MKTAGIIAEYNPFHNGHAYQLAQTRLNGATHIAVVMSGSFSQRGEPAFLLKAARCEAALQCGADLIVELPLPWACATAETFAFGAVSILNGLGCVDYLSFGSECGNISEIDRIVKLLLQADGSPELAAALATGVSFPTARERAIKLLAPQADLALLKNPNDTLAAEYLKAIRLLGSPMAPVAIMRHSAAHDSPVPAGAFASASYIRGLMSQHRLDEALCFMPEMAAVICRREYKTGRAPFLQDVAETMILSQLRRLRAEDIAGLPDVSEGLENRILSAVSDSVSLEELIFRIKTKRYTLSRIRRIIIAAFLGITKDFTQSPPPYIRVLGLNGRGAEILSAAKKSSALPVVTRRADVRKLDSFAQRVYELECLSSDLYGLCLPERIPCASEKKSSPLIIKY